MEVLDKVLLVLFLVQYMEDTAAQPPTRFSTTTKRSTTKTTTTKSAATWPSSFTPPKPTSQATQTTEATTRTKRTTKDERPFFPDPFFTVIDANMAKHHTAHYGDYRYFDANYEYTVNIDFYRHAQSLPPDYDVDPGTISEIFNTYDKLEQYWKHYKHYYGLEFIEDEEIGNEEIFQENILKFKVLSEDIPTASFRINEFTHFTLEKFTEKYTGFDPKLPNGVVPYVIGIKSYPVYLNWSAYRKYPPLKPLDDPQDCPIHFLYCAIHNIEVQILKESRNPRIGRMSYQQGYDCTKPRKTCNSKPYGQPHQVFEGLLQTEVLLRMKPGEEDGFELDWNCKDHEEEAPDHRKIAKIVNYTLLSVKDEYELLCAINEFGPISTGILVSEGLKHYKSGILTGHGCDPDKPENHAVVIVGYGTDSSKKDYWILKNSWGSKWGEDGYFRLIRGKKACGIGKYLAFPIIKRKTSPGVTTTVTTTKKRRG